MAEMRVREVFIQPRHAGRTEAAEIALLAEAATPEDGEQAIRTLHEQGFVMMRGGKVHDPALPKPPVVFFDEEPADATRMLLPDPGTAGNQRELEENENPQIEANRALERNTREQE